MYNKLHLLTVTVVVLLVGCQGMPSEKPPIHPNPNMDHQEKFLPQALNPFFEDNRADRLPVEGTIARGQLAIDVAYHQGVYDNGDFVTKIPTAVNREMLMRGKVRYDIYCQPCHGGTGAGDGIIIGYGYVPPPSFNEERVINMPDGELYSSIYNGVRSMPSYRHQIPVEDRWAIVAYIRALQRSQGASENDLNRIGLNREVLTSTSTASDVAAATY
ncbi:MAG: cytochrome c [Bacteroidetes bacterium]|nr:cytochrome c [Bacteroidota bacterium]MCH8523000.1 cytochrome c [Balneolales bacterium]